MNSISRKIGFMFIWTIMAMPVQAQEGPYFGVGLGGVVITDDEPGISLSDTAYGGFIQAGFDINEHFGFEGRIGSSTDGSGRTVYVGLPAEAKYGPNFFVSHLAKVQYPVTTALRIYGVIGITTAMYKLKITVPSLPFFSPVTYSRTRTDITFGGGIDYEIVDRWRVGGEWVRYWDNVDIGGGVEGSFDAIVGTVKYEF